MQTPVEKHFYDLGNFQMIINPLKQKFRIKVNYANYLMRIHNSWTIFFKNFNNKRYKYKIYIKVFSNYIISFNRFTTRVGTVYKILRKLPQTVLIICSKMYNNLVKHTVTKLRIFNRSLGRAKRIKIKFGLRWVKIMNS